MFSGVTSPYPTVVTVCNAHHSPVARSGNSSGSTILISTPPTITLTAVAAMITAIALRTDSGARWNASSRRLTSKRTMTSDPFWSAISTIVPPLTSRNTPSQSQPDFLKKTHSAPEVSSISASANG